MFALEGKVVAASIRALIPCCEDGGVDLGRRVSSRRRLLLLALLGRRRADARQAAAACLYLRKDGVPLGLTQLTIAIQVKLANDGFDMLIVPVIALHILLLLDRLFDVLRRGTLAVLASQRREDLFCLLAGLLRLCSCGDGGFACCGRSGAHDSQSSARSRFCR